MLSSGRAADTIAAVEKNGSGSVLIDSPPVLAVGDALIVSGLVDATLLVASANSSSRRALRTDCKNCASMSAPAVYLCARSEPTTTTRLAALSFATGVFAGIACTAPGAPMRTATATRH
jgi:hypothetical protein